MGTGYFTGLVTLEGIRKASSRMIFYGANTCWRTNDPLHLSRHPSGLPCDPRGGMPLQTEDVEGFLRTAEEHVSHYGKHGLRAFRAAHHLNCVVSRTDRRSTCFASWDDYNRILDEALAHNSRHIV